MAWQFRRCVAIYTYNNAALCLFPLLIFFFFFNKNVLLWYFALSVSPYLLFALFYLLATACLLFIIHNFFCTLIVCVLLYIFGLVAFFFLRTEFYFLPYFISLYFILKIAYLWFEGEKKKEENFFLFVFISVKYGEKILTYDWK